MFLNVDNLVLKRQQSKKEMNWEKLKQMLLTYAQEKQKLFEQIENIFLRYPYINDEQRFKELDSEQYNWIRSGNIFQKAQQTIKSLFHEIPITQQTSLNDKLQWRMQTIMNEIQFWELLPQIARECESKIKYEDPMKKIKQIEPQINDLIQEIKNLKSLYYGSMLNNFQKILNEEQEKEFKFQTKLDQKVTELHFMNLLRAEIAVHLNELDSIWSLNKNEIWFKDQKEFGAKLFKKHIPYLLNEHQKLLQKEQEAFITQLQ